MRGRDKKIKGCTTDNYFTVQYIFLKTIANSDNIVDGA